MFVTTGNYIEGHNVITYHGLVHGKKTFSDLFLYQEKDKHEARLDEELAKAEASLIAQAQKRGANAVIGIQTQFYNTGAGALGAKLMVCILSGTAVTVAPMLVK